MDFFNSPFWQSFVSNLCATIIGVGLGIPVALFINGLIEKKTRRERKNKILQVLLDETKENSVCLELWGGPQDFSKIRSVRNGILNLCVSLYTESWDAFSNGGELGWINDPFLLNTLATSYNKVSGIKFLANRYFDLAYSGNKEIDQETLEFIGIKLSERVNGALKHLSATEELLKSFIQPEK